MFRVFLSLAKTHEKKKKKKKKKTKRLCVLLRALHNNKLRKTCWCSSIRKTL